MSRPQHAITLSDQQLWASHKTLEKSKPRKFSVNRRTQKYLIFVTFANFPSLIHIKTVTQLHKGPFFVADLQSFVPSHGPLLVLIPTELLLVVLFPSSSLLLFSCQSVEESVRYIFGWNNTFPLVKFSAGISAVQIEYLHLLFC